MGKALTISSDNVKILEQTNGLSSYLAQLRKTQAPTTEEEIELFNLYHDGTKEEKEYAREQLIVRNQRFVFSIAKVYAKDSEDVIDYVNEGNFGLIEAIDKFDPKNGTKFLTFAVWYVRRQMNYYMVNTNNSIVKSNAMKLFKKTDRINQSFYAQNGRYPTIEEMSDILKEKYDIEVNDVRDLYDLSMSSIEDEIDNEFTLEESNEFAQKTATYNECEEEIEREYAKVMATKLLRAIPEDKQEIIKKLYGIGCRQYGIGELSEEYGISTEDMSKLTDDIIAYLRQEAMSEKVAI